MKFKIISIFIFSCAVAFLFSCNKTNFNYAKDTVGSSKVVYFPSIKTKGEKLIIINQGDAYSDPGADATLNGTSVQYVTTGSVDANTPGIYPVTYSATNPQGYSASDWRTVVVIGSDVSANDFSGDYLRAATGLTCNWTKTAAGVYTVVNPAGSTASVGFTAIAVNYTGTSIAIPHQISPDYGELSTSDETYTLAPAPPKFSWVIHAGGFGTALRTFTKQ